MFGEVVEPDYMVQKLQTLVNNNLKNWGARSAKRYRTQWVNRISPWNFAQECPAKKILAAHKLQRLAAILSPKTVGIRALKQNAEPVLAQKAYEQAHEKWKNLDAEMDAHKAAWGYNGDPEGWTLLKDRGCKLKELFGKADKRRRACEEESLEKKQRVS